jgi:hypothetical protein
MAAIIPLWFNRLLAGASFPVLPLPYLFAPEECRACMLFRALAESACKQGGISAYDIMAVSGLRKPVLYGLYVLLGKQFAQDFL